MINFNKLEELYKDKKQNLILLIVNIVVLAFNITNLVINIIRENIVFVAIFGVLVGALLVVTILLIIAQVIIGKAYKKEQERIEFETFLESQHILRKAFEQLDKKLQEKKQSIEKAEAEKAQSKKKAEPKVKAETKENKKK